MGGITLAGYASRLWTGRPTESSPSSSPTTQKTGKSSSANAAISFKSRKSSQGPTRKVVVDAIVKELESKFFGGVWAQIGYDPDRMPSLMAASTAFEEKVRAQAAQLLRKDIPDQKDIAAAKSKIEEALASEVSDAVKWINEQSKPKEEGVAVLDQPVRSRLSTAAPEKPEADTLQSAGKQRVEGRQLAQMASATQLEAVDLARESFQPASPPAPLFEAALETINVPESEPPAAPPTTPELDEDSDYLPPDDLPPAPNVESDGADLNQTAAGSAPPNKPLPPLPLNAAAPPPPGPPPTDVLPPPDAPPALPNNPPAGHQSARAELSTAAPA